MTIVKAPGMCASSSTEARVRMSSVFRYPQPHHSQRGPLEANRTCARDAVWQRMKDYIALFDRRNQYGRARPAVAVCVFLGVVTVIL